MIDLRLMLGLGLAVVLSAPRHWITQRDAARHAHVSLATIKRAKARGELHFEQIGRLTRTTYEWVDEWVQRQNEGQRKNGRGDGDD